MFFCNSVPAETDGVEEVYFEFKNCFLVLPSDSVGEVNKRWEKCV